MDASFDSQQHLFALAYRMLGSAVDAEDAVQEAFCRLQQQSSSEVRSEKALLTTIVTRICLDVLKSARKTREVYVGPWLPEPIATTDEIDRESVSLAFLLLLERLSPAERAAYLLVEVFDHSHDEVAAILGRRSPAVRKLLSRARSHMKAGRARFCAPREEHLRLLTGFVAAASGGDLEALKALLAEDVALASDGGGKVVAARKVVHGPDAVARMILGFAKKEGAHVELRFLEVNGALSVAFFLAGSLETVLSIDVDRGRIRNVFNFRNPDKLAHLGRALGAA